MDSNASGFYVNRSSLHSFQFQPKQEDGIIDLGLSLRALQPEIYHSSGHGMEGYGDIIDWTHQADSKLKSSNTRYRRLMPEECDDEAEGIQSKERWAYVKVNMDGVVVGRKICIVDHSGFSSLVFQIEDMFGRHAANGLRLFQASSIYSLFYKDRDENWRAVGDVPWKEFIECVRRLRIARKDEALLFSSSTFN
ncbi:AUX_IAA domain-containing protein [Cephalotus follicularis]|uniref:Auxin-responsive protein n=1 Tax=Cephalotus follicularis TaxID=3775 RepID=A0A1Q3DF96_CEPFO|nr:AUX_IAA domain-containing protein [Cephalotus follicularis]